MACKKILDRRKGSHVKSFPRKVWTTQVRGHMTNSLGCQVSYKSNGNLIACSREIVIKCFPFHVYKSNLELLPTQLNFDISIMALDLIRNILK